MPSPHPYTASHPDEWLCSWLSTSQPTSGDAFPIPLEIPALLHDQTLRQTLRITVGGNSLRLVFTNRYGTQPLVLQDGYLSVMAPCSAPHSSKITFNGQSCATIPAGQLLYSDEIALQLSPLAILNLRLYLPESTPLSTFHWDARQLSWLEPGNQAHREAAQQGKEISSRLLLESVQVKPARAAKTIVVIGDSMVDGNGVEINTYGRWTDHLAQRFASHDIAIVNAGQSGSRLLKEGIGISTLSRFESDVLNQPGIAACIVQVGLNDLGLAGSILDPHSPTPTASMLIAGYRQLLSASRQKGIRLIGVTLVPLRASDEYGLENFYQPEKEAIRQQVNHWMRTSGEFDAVIDSDQLIRDPIHSQQLNQQYDSGDHLHLNDKGHLLIAASISLEMLLGQS